MLRASEIKVGDVLRLFYKDGSSIFTPFVVVSVHQRDDERWHIDTLYIEEKYHEGAIGDNGNGLETFDDEICEYKKIGHTDLVETFLAQLVHDNAWKKGVA